MGEETRTDNKHEENKTADKHEEGKIADRLEVREENEEITADLEVKTAA